MAVTPLHPKQLLCFLSCATSWTAALQVRGNSSATHIGITATLITLQWERERKQTKWEGKTEEKEFCFHRREKNHEHAAVKSKCPWLRNRKTVRLKGRGLTLGCNWLVDAINSFPSYLYGNLSLHYYSFDYLLSTMNLAGELPTKHWIQSTNPSLPPGNNDDVSDAAFPDVYVPIQFRRSQAFITPTRPGGFHPVGEGSSHLYTTNERTHSDIEVTCSRMMAPLSHSWPH